MKYATTRAFSHLGVVGLLVTANLAHADNLPTAAHRIDLNIPACVSEVMDPSAIVEALRLELAPNGYFVVVEASDAAPATPALEPEMRIGVTANPCDAQATEFTVRITFPASQTVIERNISVADSVAQARVRILALGTAEMMRMQRSSPLDSATPPSTEMAPLETPAPTSTSTPIQTSTATPSGTLPTQANAAPVDSGEPPTPQTPTVQPRFLIGAQFAARTFANRLGLFYGPRLAVSIPLSSFIVLGIDGGFEMGRDNQRGFVTNITLPNIGVTPAVHFASGSFFVEAGPRVEVALAMVKGQTDIDGFAPTGTQYGTLLTVGASGRLAWLFQEHFAAVLDVDLGGTVLGVSGDSGISGSVESLRPPPEVPLHGFNGSARIGIGYAL